MSFRARRIDGLTGVYMERRADEDPGAPERKIASIGVGVRGWVSFHGFALNCAVDPVIYERFRPCGLDGAVMTDLRAHRDDLPPRAALEDLVSREAHRVYTENIRTLPRSNRTAI